MGSQKQWVLEKPRRGREMVTKDVAGQEKGRSVRMHEGYVGTQKYMVPDEDLLVMKELVDYRLGKNPDDRYVKDYDYAPEKEADEKFRKMSHRLQKLSSSNDEDENAKKEEEPPVKDTRKIRFEDTISSSSSSTTSTTSTSGKTTTDSSSSKKPGDDEAKSESTAKAGDDDSKGTAKTGGTSLTSEGSDRTTPEEHEPKSKEEETDDDDDSSSSHSDEEPPTAVRDSTVTAKTLPFNVQPDRIRFLLSGHIRNDMKPIFIFHQYNGKSPFGKQADFYSAKREGGVDLYISGRFYKKSILEEVNNKLKSLDIKPEKIIIDDRCKVFEESFYELLQVGKVDVDFQGKFLKQLDTKKYTPLLAFNVQNTSGSTRSSRSYESSKSPQSVDVYIAKPVSRNIFEPNQKENEIAAENSEHRPKKPVKRDASWTPKPEDDLNKYEPHLKKNPSRNPSERQPARRARNPQRDAGDVGSDRAMVYHCDVNRRRSSKGKNIFQRISQMFFSRN